MRDQISVYDQMLRIQAEMAFPLERPLFCSAEWEKAENVLDFGCGNADYISKLADLWPNKSYTGVEYDAQMAAVACKRHTRPKMKIITGTLDDLPAEFRFDFLVARLVMMHLADRKSISDWAASHASKSAGALIIDADDEHFRLFPSLPHFENALATLRQRTHQRGGNRDVRSAVEKEWEEGGFRHIATQRLIIHSELPSAKERMFLYMVLTAELGIGSPLPPEILEELLAWVLDPTSYAQYGIFGATFEWIK
ncbi:MAG: class I SAM-dependent methyltransferase [Armatimonadetes bacterium]|nr:class I SAM-dependent methyltransferase [Armatimonadota bacterium]